MKSFTANQVSLGFVGIGAMGSRIVRRLRAHDYPVTVYDRTHSKAFALVNDGATVASTLAELAGHADVILSCLSNDEAVRDVYLGSNGVLAASHSGTVVLEMSTISPTTSREINAEGRKRGIDVLDVSISGSTPAVEQGTLTLLVGGDAEIFQAAQPIFDVLAAHCFLMGPSGSGTSMKLVVNTLLGVGMQAIAEAISLGEAEGIERQHLLRVLSQTAVIAPAHVGKLARAEHEDFSPQFGIALMNKDFRLILEAAKSLNLDLATTTSAFEANSAALNEDPNADFSSVIRLMENAVELKIAS